MFAFKNSSISAMVTCSFTTRVTIAENTENKTNIKPKGFLEKLTERVKEFLENAE